MIERKDKLKNKITVAKELLKNPLSTEKELKEKTWLWAWTVHRQKKEVEKNGVESDIIDRVLEMDDDIMELVNSITYKKLKEKVDGEHELSLPDLKIMWDLANNSTKRKAIFDKWDKLDPNRDIVIQI